MSTSPTLALSADAIHQAMDEVLLLDAGSSWRRVQSEDLTSNQDTIDLQRDLFDNDDPLVYGLVSEKNMALFYISFSTWDGRVLYWNPTEDYTKEERVEVMHLLANIAIRLECTRLVWQHYESTRVAYKEMGATTLDGFLTLRLDRAAMQRFLMNTHPPFLVTTRESYKGPLTSKAVQHAIHDTLVPINNTVLHDKQLRLTLATKKDVPDIQRLVQGLADYEDELDAVVRVTAEQFRLDGFEKKPLYYCLLLQDTVVDNYSCGIALIYFGYDSKGRFLYLEDLFIEDNVRGRGGGKSVMWTLAKIAQSLDCGSFVWQALEWDKHALAFYDTSIGAKVVDGLLMSRLTNNDLVEFASTTT